RRKRMARVVALRGDDILGVNRPGRRPAFYGQLLRRLSQLVAARSDAVIVVADHMRDHIPSSAPIHVIPSGLDFDSLTRLPQTEARRSMWMPAHERLVPVACAHTYDRTRLHPASLTVETLNA